MFKDGDGQEEQEKHMWAVIKKVMWKRVDPRVKGLKDTFNKYEGRGLFSLF